MGVNTSLLLINCFIIYFMFQLVGAERNVSDIYLMDLKVLSGNKEDTGRCTSREDCNFLCDCQGNFGGKYCKCFQGISGKNCDIIDECVDNPGMCGNDPDVSCGFHRKKKRIICECRTFGKRFDIPTKTCVDQKPCKSYKECFNGADCLNANHEEDGKEPHYCECKFGTSGDYCERIEECIDNPNYCGDGDGVICSYNKFLMRAYCQCKNRNQRFDWPQKRCVERNKCRTSEDCLPFGQCQDKCITWEPCQDFSHIEKKRSCHCIEGTSGEHCQVIDDCYNKVVDCGTSNNVTCDYYHNHGLTAYAFCRCKDRDLKFDPYDKQCKACHCGDGATSCNFIDGVKTCSCNRGFYYNGVRCRDCDCGDDAEGCTFTKSGKICICNTGYKDVGGICESE
ncbi:delta-like protein C [Parasteatoda tepidariorum]|uniref:delta-like protein C n=1 Tax=Parasteatoda tepidariorum TaxID=114398 RepID=UPI001C7243FD|nr:protein lin-12 [Parasteatoda tepidariorum]